MTRKHFQELAEIIATHNLPQAAIDDIISMCKRSNRGFKQEVFAAAIEKASS